MGTPWSAVMQDRMVTPKGHRISQVFVHTYLIDLKKKKPLYYVIITLNKMV